MNKYLFYHILANTRFYHYFDHANLIGEKYYVVIILRSISFIANKPEWFHTFVDFLCKLPIVHFAYAPLSLLGEGVV